MAESASSPPAFDVAHAEAGRRLGSVLVRTAYAARVVGVEHFPRDGATILVSNHTGFLDGPVVFCLAPRPVHFLVKRSYFASAWGAILRGVGQIPIEQGTGDRAALGAARAVLADGGCVGIFPEGTRGAGDVRALQQGAAWLALQSGARLLPVAVLGTRGTGAGRESWPRPRSPLRVVVGEPFDLVDLGAATGRQRLTLATDRIRDVLASHVRQAVETTGIPLPSDAADG